MPPTWPLEVAALCIALPVLAGPLDEPPPPAVEPIGMELAVELALANNPLLDAASEQVVAAEAERKLAGTGYYPRLDFTEDFARSDNPVFVFASKLGQEKFTSADFALDSLNRPDPFTNFATRFVLRQNIWDAGRTDKGKRVMTEGIEASRHAQQRTRDEVAFGAIQAFWSLAVAQEMLDVARDAESAARANVDLATEQVDAGLAVLSDRMTAEVRLAEVEALRIRAEVGLDVARAALVRATGLEGDRRFTAVPPAGTPAPDDRDVEAHVDEALLARPDLLALDRRIRQAEIGVNMAKNRRLPEFGAGAAYEWNGDTVFGSDGSNWSVGVGLRVPVFDGNDTGAYVARARAGLAGASAMRKAMRQGVRLEIQAAWAERESARRRYDVAAAALGRSQEALRIVRERYGEGMAVMVELLAAEAAQTQARANHVAARGDWWLAQAALDLAAGRQPFTPGGAAAGTGTGTGTGTGS